MVRNAKTVSVCSLIIAAAGSQSALGQQNTARPCDTFFNSQGGTFTLSQTFSPPRTITSSSVIAYAASSGSALRTGKFEDECWCFSDCFRSCGDGDIDAGTTSASASAGCLAGQPGGLLNWTGSASASGTITGSMLSITIATESTQSALRDKGIATGGSSAGLSMSFESSLARTFEATGTFAPTLTSGVPRSTTNTNDFATGRRFQAFVTTGTGVTGCDAYIIETPSGTETSNATFNTMTGEYDVSCTVSIGTGLIELTSTAFNATEDGVDLSNDGRFNQADVVALSAIVGTSGATDPANLELYDYDSSGTIDTADVDILQAVLNTGVGAGVFADADGDGDVDCADRAFAPASPWNETIGGTGYVVEFDVDLDGDLDATDEDAFNRRFGDFAAPIGIYDLDDVDAFIAAFLAGDPLADLVVPFGVVDLDDSDAFNAAWLAACP